MRDLGGGFFGGGAPAGTDGGGSVGDAVTVFSKQSGTIKQATNPNTIAVFTPPADGIYAVIMGTRFTVLGVGVGNATATVSYTDIVGNVVVGALYEQVPDGALVTGWDDNFPFSLKGGVPFVMQVNFDDAPAEMEYIIVVQRLA